MTASADESCRYILAPAAPLLANLSALWLNNPELAAELEALPEPPEYSTEPARSGDLTLWRYTSDGRKVYLHSRFEPADEAHRLIAGLNVEGKSVFYILGLGLGYHLQALVDVTGEESIL